MNEITDIAETRGLSWITPLYNRVGNMTRLPKPSDPTSAYTATYDAWNRLVKIEDGANTVAEYQYDGAKRRTLKKTYSGGVLDETRHFHYTQPAKWQVVEERVDASSSADRQFVWGLRYVDDLVLRDRDTTGNGTLDERLYALQDTNWNVAGIAGSDGAMQERFAYSAYGTPTVLAPAFASRAASNYCWETRYAGYRWDGEVELCQVRSRLFRPGLGWLQRDPQKYHDSINLYEYVVGNPTMRTDPFGKNWFCDWATDECTGNLMSCACFLIGMADLLSNFLAANPGFKVAAGLLDCACDTFGAAQASCYRMCGKAGFHTYVGQYFSCLNNLLDLWGFAKGGQIYDFLVDLWYFFGDLITMLMDEQGLIEGENTASSLYSCFAAAKACGLQVLDLLPVVPPGSDPYGPPVTPGPYN